MKSHLDHIEAHCESCKKNQKAKPRPVVALPRASKFNQVVSIDLKTYPEGKYNYICYLVDLFSRLIVGAFIENKLPSTVASVILKQWMAPMGRMDTLHSDRGGEFCNEELTAVAEYLGVRSTLTAANSPNQNGIKKMENARSKFVSRSSSYLGSCCEEFTRQCVWFQSFPNCFWGGTQVAVCVHSWSARAGGGGNDESDS